MSSKYLKIQHVPANRVLDLCFHYGSAAGRHKSICTGRGNHAASGFGWRGCTQHLFRTGPFSHPEGTYWSLPAS